VIEENASFNLLLSQGVQGHTSTGEHQNISTQTSNISNNFGIKEAISIHINRAVVA
jgi:hypothetical protein